MYEHILVPTDGSDGTDRSLEHAIEIGNDHDATIHALYVIDKRVYRAADDEAQDDVMASLTEEGETAVERIRDRAESAGLDVITTIESGIPYREILEYADAETIDLIAMGTHGRTGRDRVANLGSVTDRVVQNTEQPVLVVRIDDE
ncbi:MAG: universal stress protein [Halobacteriales archaeon]|nr:universal stress protein [Halobacteriales archaeon]